uniref:Recep_L_domain domain-containing protein n=1 Tax=Meloidogyne hapla TaxID=6305 RepID=A0A1I8BI22_MELHA
MNIFFVSILFLLTRNSKFSLASMVEDEDINKGNQYRREEFNNKTEPEFNKNVANQLYVLLEQFSMKSCTNMLDHCSFAMEHLLAHFPGYLNCDSFYEGNKPGNNSDNVIYKKDCKINYTKVHPELASLATDSYQCLWPLINPGRLSLINDGFTNSSLNNIQLEPVIDGCYLPCRSPLFDFGDLYNYNFVVAILHFCIVLVVLLAISFIVAKVSCF